VTWTLPINLCPPHHSSELFRRPQQPGNSVLDPFRREFVVRKVFSHPRRAAPGFLVPAEALPKQAVPNQSNSLVGRRPALILVSCPFVSTLSTYRLSLFHGRSGPIFSSLPNTITFFEDEIILLIFSRVSFFTMPGLEQPVIRSKDLQFQANTSVLDSTLIPFTDCHIRVTVAP